MSNQDKLKVALKDFTWLSVMDIAWVYEVDPEPVQDEDGSPLYKVKVDLTVKLASGQWVCIIAPSFCTDSGDVIGTLTRFKDYRIVVSADGSAKWLNLGLIGEAMFKYLKEHAIAFTKNTGERVEVVYY